MSTETNKNWVENAIDEWLDSLDPKKLTFKKIVFVMKQCLNIISLNDACNYMEEHKISLTEENIAKFIQMADKYYLIRINILKELVLDKYNKSK